MDEKKVAEEIERAIDNAMGKFAKELADVIVDAIFPRRTIESLSPKDAQGLREILEAVADRLEEVEKAETEPIKADFVDGMQSEADEVWAEEHPDETPKDNTWTGVHNSHLEAALKQERKEEMKETTEAKMKQEFDSIGWKCGSPRFVEHADNPLDSLADDMGKRPPRVEIGESTDRFGHRKCMTFAEAMKSLEQGIAVRRSSWPTYDFIWKPKQIPLPEGCRFSQLDPVMKMAISIRPGNTFFDSNILEYRLEFDENRKLQGRVIAGFDFMGIDGGDRDWEEFFVPGKDSPVCDKTE